MSRLFIIGILIALFAILSHLVGADRPGGERQTVSLSAWEDAESPAARHRSAQRR